VRSVCQSKLMSYIQSSSYEIVNDVFTKAKGNPYICSSSLSWELTLLLQNGFNAQLHTVNIYIPKYSLTNDAVFTKCIEPQQWWGTSQSNTVNISITKYSLTNDAVFTKCIEHQQWWCTS
jgi:hypothetical protein